MGGNILQRTLKARRAQIYICQVVKLLCSNGSNEFPKAVVNGHERVELLSLAGFNAQRSIDALYKQRLYQTHRPLLPPLVVSFCSSKAIVTLIWGGGRCFPRLPTSSNGILKGKAPTAQTRFHSQHWNKTDTTSYDVDGSSIKLISIDSFRHPSHVIDCTPRPVSTHSHNSSHGHISNVRTADSFPRGIGEPEGSRGSRFDAKVRHGKYDLRNQVKRSSKRLQVTLMALFQIG